MTLVMASTGIRGHFQHLYQHENRWFLSSPTHISISYLWDRQQTSHLSQQRGRWATEPLRQLELGVGLES